MKDEFGNRMKRFERLISFTMPGNNPVFVRIDGKGFSKWTKQIKAEKPFDDVLSGIFINATMRTCESIGQVIMAYGQSDEVTFLLDGWRKPESQIYFGGNIQKIDSVIASMFTAHFNDWLINSEYFIAEPAMFDARVWTVPEYELENVFRWRQQDAKRNSIQGLAQSLYSHKELNGKSQKEQLRMCLLKGADWDYLPILQKWGFVVRKETYTINVGDGPTERNRWVSDRNIPQFTKDKNYIKDIMEE